MFSVMIKKEFLLVLRDKHALMALFVMPAIFIVIMSIAMRDQFNTKNLAFTLVIKENNTTNDTKNLLQNLQKDTTFHLVQDESQAEFSIVLPNGYENNVSIKLPLYIHGSLRESKIKAFQALFSKYIYTLRLKSMTKGMEEIAPEKVKQVEALNFSAESLYSLSYQNQKMIPNATQQSVPAWIVFGMFFIIIPMSTIYINERKQNTLLRLHSMNVSLLGMTLTKSIPYFIINQLQVWIMIAVGMFIVPFFDTPPLEINGSLGAIIEVSIGLSLSAIGISTLIAVSANSSEQATTIGGISNILLGAIGGVMVPKFIMPESMQKIAELSPMSWGLDGFLDIFLTGADSIEVFPYFIKLTLLGVFLLGVSMLILHFRIRKGL